MLGAFGTSASCHVRPRSGPTFGPRAGSAPALHRGAQPSGEVAPGGGAGLALPTVTGVGARRRGGDPPRAAQASGEGGRSLCHGSLLSSKGSYSEYVPTVRRTYP